MIVCPNCNHQNPDGAVQCEACYTPLPATTSCSNCGAAVQTDASFCGQCGFNLKVAAPAGDASSVAMPPPPPPTISPQFELPDLISPDPLVEPEPLTASSPSSSSSNQEFGLPPEPVPPPAPIASEPAGYEQEEHPAGIPLGSSAPPEVLPISPPPPVKPSPAGGSSSTQLQIQSARLLHIQTNTLLELPQNLSVVHLGKPNDRIPPDIDVSGFPDSEIVSRIHADIRVEGDIYYIEDVGSSNGTYVNNAPLPMGNRHRLRPGDRIALGKGDRVTFLFQMS